MFDGSPIEGDAKIIEKPSNVRLAGPQDEAALYDLLMSLDEDNGFGFPVTKERVEEAIAIGTQRKGGMIGVIDGKRGQYGEAGEIAASVAVTLQRFWYSDQWFLGEGWLFVRPEYRANHMEKSLFQFAKWSAAEMKLPLVLSMWARQRLPAKLRLWSRHAEQVGGIFMVR